MFRFTLPAILVLTSAAHAAPAEMGQLDASPTLFTVLAAINAAGYDADLASPNNVQLRQDIRAEIAKRNPPSLNALKIFFGRHRLRNETAELGQYISYALTVDGPPNFAITKLDEQVPPDVVGMKELSPILAAFYKEAGIEELWTRSQRAIDQYVSRYQAPVSEAVLNVNLYVRQATSGVRGYRFQVLIELLAAPNQVQTRSYGNQYTVVVSPSPEPRTFDVRHGYLHYVLDPLGQRHREVLDRKKGLGDHAKRAPALGDSFKDDFVQLATESLIKAMEARLDKNPEAVQQALREGFILAPYFAEKLPAYEKEEVDFRTYYPEMIAAIDLYKEDRRLTQVEFVSQAPVRAVKTEVQPAEPAPLTGVARTLDEAERLYLSRDADASKKLFLEVLQQTDQKPMHAAAYYGLARIAIFQKDPETADRLFRKSLETGPEPQVKAWDLVYLGRLALAAGEREQAAEFLQDALKVEGASEKARQEASKSLEQTKQ